MSNNNLSQKEKQLKYENFLQKQYEDVFIENKNSLGVNVDLLSKELKIILIDFYNDFTKYLNHTLLSFKESKDKLNTNEYFYYVILTTLQSKIDNKKKIVSVSSTLYSILIYQYLLFISNKEDESRKDVYQLTSWTVKIGRIIWNTYKSRMYYNYLHDNKDNKDNLSLKKWYEKNKNELLENSDDRFIFIGGKMFDILKNCNLIDYEVITKRNEFNKIVKNTRLIIPPQMEKFIKEIKRIVLPIKLPMVFKPNVYSKDNLGGYLLNDINYGNELIIQKNYLYNLPFKIIDENIIYETINNLMLCPYKINIDVFEFILIHGVDLGIILNLDETHKYENIKRSSYQDKIYKSFKSKLFLETIILDIANIYKNSPNIYFPLRLDQRGRIYCEPSYFNYQSTDLAKSLIYFSNPGFIARSDKKSIKYLKIFGANCFGLSKKSIKDRLIWIEKNEQDIINFYNLKLIRKADSKALFVAFCLEYKKWIEYYNSNNNEDFKTYLPIQLDATCNGFQHLALLSNESELYEKLNITSKNTKNWQDEEPYDLYMYILILITQKLKTILNETHFSNKNYDTYKRLNNFFFNRNNIKKIIMTIPYNSTLQSQVKYLKESLFYVEYDNLSEQQKNELGDGGKNFKWFSVYENLSSPLINHKDILEFVSFASKIIKLKFNKIDQLRKYLKNVTDICTKLGVSIMWTLPHGLEITQSYMDEKTVRLSPFSSIKTKISLSVKKDTYNFSKQRLALMPNLIHSLDSYSVFSLRYEFEKIFKNFTNFYSIHDCFAVTSDKVIYLMTLIKLVYTNLYIKDKYLMRFDNNIINNILYIYGDNIEINSRTFTIKNGERAGEKYELYDINNIIHTNKNSSDKDSSDKDSSDKNSSDINSNYILN